MFTDYIRHRVVHRHICKDEIRFNDRGMTFVDCAQFLHQAGNRFVRVEMAAFSGNSRLF